MTVTTIPLCYINGMTRGHSALWTGYAGAHLTASITIAAMKTGNIASAITGPPFGSLIQNITEQIAPGGFGPPHLPLCKNVVVFFL